MKEGEFHSSIFLKYVSATSRNVNLVHVHTLGYVCRVKNIFLGQELVIHNITQRHKHWNTLEKEDSDLVWKYYL